MLKGLGIAAVMGTVSLVALSSAPAMAQPSTIYGLPTALYPYFTLLDAAQNAFALSLNSIITRPVSPFSAGLATQTDPGYCGPGLWDRINGGTAERDVPSAGDIHAQFVDLTVGADISCFDVDDADYSFGLLGGVVKGVGTEDGQQGEVDLTRTTAGAYGTYAKGPFSAYIEAYGDKSVFSASDDLGYVTGDFLTVDRAGLAGAASVQIDMGDKMSLIPVAGFDTSSASFNNVTFNPNLVDASLQLDDFKSTTIYGGLTLQKIFVLDDTSAVVPFISGTIYDRLDTSVTGTAVYNGDNYSFDVPEDAEQFAEVGGGLNYAKILNGEIGSAKQLSLTGRIDYKWNENSNALNVTGQARLQF